MDFKSLKDVHNLNELLKGMGADIVNSFMSVKDVNVEKFKTGFNTYFIDYLKNNYLEFKGRVSRRQYWMFTLYSAILGFVFGVICGLIPVLKIFALLFVLALIIPSIGLGVRRLHDLNLSGLFYLIAFIPFVGGLAILFLFCMPGDKEDNNFGAVQ